jgi:uncharacterized protein
MTTSQPYPTVLPQLNWDPDLLVPLEMDGYLTGILLTPELEVSDWIAGLWTGMPPVADEVRMTRALGAVLARRKAIEADLQKGWPGFQPSFSVPGPKADHDRIRTWVKGFWQAMKVYPEYWSELADDERTATFIGLFAGFIDTGLQIDERDDADEIRDEHAALLPRAIVGMRQLALMRDGNATALRSMQAKKAGRNDPCPCGSGKKFKRCCGAN